MSPTRRPPLSTQLVVGSFLSLAALSAGAAVAIESDSAWWSAGALVAEPITLVIAALALYGLWVRGWWLVAALLSVAFAGNALLARVPRPGSSQIDAAPKWAANAQSCAGSVALPTASFRLLQWTIDPATPEASVVRAVETSAADVVVLQGAIGPDLADAVQSMIGGESRLIGGSAPIAIFTRGVFHPCDDTTLFRAHPDDDRTYALAFIGAREGASFPLLVGQLPPVEVGTGWEHIERSLRDELGSTIGALQSSTLVVALDAHAPWTFSHLNARFAAVGLRLVPTAVDWPLRLGPVPWLPVHPYNRLWIGEAWTYGATARVHVETGTRAPIVTDLDPRLHTAQY